MAKEKQNHDTHIKIPEALYRRVCSKAAADGKHFTQAVVEALTQYLKEKP